MVDYWERQSCTVCWPLCDCITVLWTWFISLHGDKESSHLVLGIYNCLGVSFPIPDLICTYLLYLKCVHHRVHGQPHYCICSWQGEMSILHLHHRRGIDRWSPCSSCGVRCAGHGRLMLTIEADLADLLVWVKCYIHCLCESCFLVTLTPANHAVVGILGLLLQVVSNRCHLLHRRKYRYR